MCFFFKCALCDLFASLELHDGLSGLKESKSGTEATHTLQGINDANEVDCYS